MSNQLNSLVNIPSSGAVSVYSALNPFFQPGSLSGACASLATAIWNNKNIDRIKQEIDKCITPDKKFTEYKLTPFHLAAIQENGQAMEALLQAGARIDAKDWKEYTALHHMALKGNTQAVSALLKRGAKPELRNAHGSTYADLLRFNAPFRKPDSNFVLNPALFSAHTVDRAAMEPSCLPKGVRISEEVVAKPEALFGMWSVQLQFEPFPGQKKFHHFLLEEKYQPFKQKPPALRVAPVKFDDEKKPIEESFCGLFADSPIKKGDIIAEYTGEMITEEAKARLKNMEYLESDFPAIDSIKYRSPASMANDGFPNAGVLNWGFTDSDIKGIDGLPVRKILIAHEDIQPGEQIVINYGPGHLIKHSSLNHIEMRRAAMREFFAKNSWEELISKIELYSSQSKEEHFTALIYQEKVNYLFDTPSELRWFLEEGLMTQKDIELIKESAKKSLVISQVYQKLLDLYERMRRGTRDEL